MTNEQLLHPAVTSALDTANIAVRVLPCDSNFADTAAFNDKYGFSSQQSANTILVASKKADPVKYAVCVVLASTRLDVNKTVTKLLGVRKASFADADTTKQMTGMEIGGVTAVGISGLPIYVDRQVMAQPEVVMGGGNRTSKIIIDPQDLTKLPNVTLVDDLAKGAE